MSWRSAVLGCLIVACLCSTVRGEACFTPLLASRYSRPVLPEVLAAANTAAERDTVFEGPVPSVSTKTPGKALLLSALVPGTGELYVGAKRGWVFLGVEVAFWVTHLVLDRKGEELKDDYEQFADEHWDAGRYLQWETYLDTVKSSKTHELPMRCQDDQCEPIKSQDYYEMIGKYDQFVIGWDDNDAKEPLSQYDTIESLGAVLSEHRLGYRDMRAESNDYLKPAGYILGAILFNHVISALDAGRCARAQGESLTAHPIRLEMRIKADGDRPLPMLWASKRF